MTATLHGVRHPGLVTAAGALAWFTAAQRPGRAVSEGVIGYLLAPDRAEWFRCDGPVPHGPEGPRDLSDTFEIFATSGTSQLRWVHESTGRGWAVSLAEDAAALPPGPSLPVAPERRRLDGTATRLLAGQVIAGREGWATLATARYAPCDVPVTATSGQEVWAELAEYAVRDEHGNLSVADTLLLCLAARTRVPVSGAARAPVPAGEEH